MMGGICRDTVVWEYAMRREMQEIIPGLFLGPYSCATRTKLDFLLNHGITHVVCIRHLDETAFVRANFPDKFNYFVLDIANRNDENILKFIPRVNKYITEALDKGGKVFIHGNAGISRCAAITIAFLMETFGLGTNEAFSYVQQRRMCINPNDGFMAQLREFEPIYRAKQMFKDSQLSQPNLKRPLSLFLEEDKLI